MNKQITHTYRPDNFHWVGDGFPVTTLFSYHDEPHLLSPFLLLDFAGPAEFTPASEPRGVGMHPHRGFETVTIVYQGELEHRDNKGNSGKIGPGDVQWMTAARGILHEEKHSRAFTQSGGQFEAIQLWVNLPAAHKMDAPHYQEILAEKIPVLEFKHNGGYIRVIAGEYEHQPGYAKTYTPINLWDVRLNAGHDLNLTIPAGYNCLLLVLSGDVTVNNTHHLGEKELAVLEREGDALSLNTQKGAKLLVLNGQPIDEPMIGQGPFVMNNAKELEQAFADFRAGRF